MAVRAVPGLWVRATRVVSGRGELQREIGYPCEWQSRGRIPLLAGPGTVTSRKVVLVRELGNGRRDGRQEETGRDWLAVPQLAAHWSAGPWRGCGSKFSNLPKNGPGISNCLHVGGAAASDTPLCQGRARHQRVNVRVSGTRLDSAALKLPRTQPFSRRPSALDNQTIKPLSLLLDHMSALTGQGEPMSSLVRVPTLGFGRAGASRLADWQGDSAQNLQ